jgi:hypothetical protein
MPVQAITKDIGRSIPVSKKLADLIAIQAAD